MKTSRPKLVLAFLVACPLIAQETKVTRLMAKDLTDCPGKEGLMITVVYPPGGSDPAHRHNAYAFVYVLEGSVVMQVKGGKAVTLMPGQSFYEGPNDIHIVGRNASKTKPAKFIAFLVKEKGAPVLIPLQPGGASHADEGKRASATENKQGGEMKAARVVRFGPPDVIGIEDLPRPEPAAGQLLVRVKAAGVGNWDALTREGKLHQPLPLTLGFELSGIVEETGADVSGFNIGDEVYGATNEQLTGAYAEYALPLARMMAEKPRSLNFIQAASAPIVTVTAWQMLFEYAHVTAGQTVLIHGAAGNVGAYAVQLSTQAGVHVVATAASSDLEYVRRLGAKRVVDYQTERFEESVTGVDAVLDTVGGDTQQRSLGVLKPGGILVSVVSAVPEAEVKRYGIRAAYFYVDVTTARLDKIAELFDSGRLVTNVGTVLPLEDARVAHEMLGGARHDRGKIVLRVAA